MSKIKLTNDVLISKESLDLGNLLNGISQRWADVSNSILNTWVSNFGNVSNTGDVIGYNMQLTAGTYLVIGKYDITGANADAGIRLYVNEQVQEEVFCYRGSNASWKHPIILITTATLSSNGSMRLGYYINSAGTITSPRLTAIPINKIVG